MARRQNDNVQKLLQEIEENIAQNQNEISELNKHIREVDKSQKEFTITNQ